MRRFAHLVRFAACVAVLTSSFFSANTGSAKAQTGQKIHSTEGFDISINSKEINNNLLTMEFHIINNLKVRQYVVYCAVGSPGNVSMKGASLRLDINKISGMPVINVTGIEYCVPSAKLENMTYIEPGQAQDFSLVWYGESGSAIPQSAVVSFSLYMVARTSQPRPTIDTPETTQPPGAAHPVIATFSGISVVDPQ